MALYLGKENPYSLVARCSCSSPGHIVSFDYFEGDHWIYVQTGLDPQRPWYRRLWTSIKYLFAPQKVCNYQGMEVVLGQEDVKNLLAWCALRIHDIDQARAKDIEKLKKEK